mgnify:CR=1 FL=1
MLLARILVEREESVEYLHALADALHGSLVESCEVTNTVRFEAILQHEVGELIFDPHYLGGPRSHDFVLIAITAGRPRSVETKQRFYRDLVEKLGRATGLNAEDVMVVISTTAGDEWSFGGGRGN